MGTPEPAERQQPVNTSSTCRIQLLTNALAIPTPDGRSPSKNDQSLRGRSRGHGPPSLLNRWRSTVQINNVKLTILPIDSCRPKPPRGYSRAHGAIHPLNSCQLENTPYSPKNYYL